MRLQRVNAIPNDLFPKRDYNLKQVRRELINDECEWEPACSRE